MKACSLRLAIMLLAGVAFFMLTACGTTAPTRFYLMGPIGDEGAIAPASGAKAVSLALAPVELPDHLKRPQMVTRKSGHQVKVDEFNRWAEPLEVHVTAILAENLSRLLATEGVTISSRHKRADFDYHLAVNFSRFDGWPGKEARLDCRWYLGTGDAPAGAHAERFSATRPLAGSDYADLVAALSDLLADLSREIARKIDAE